MFQPGVTNPQVEEAVANQIAQCSTITMNVAQRALVIAEDRLELCLVKNIERIQARRAWIAPLGNVITVAAVLFTATFRNRILICGRLGRDILVTTYRLPDSTNPLAPCRH